MMYSPLVLRKILMNEQYSALLFCSAEDLDQQLSGNLTPEQKIVIAAELFARYYLNPASDLKSLLKKYFRSGEVDDFYAVFHADPFDRVDRLPDFIWRSDDPFSSACEKAVRKRLEELFSEEKTAGFIPVFSPEGQGFFIPFHFVPCRLDADIPDIADLNGTPVAAWSVAYRNALPQNTRFRCVVHCYQELLPEPLSGPSFMLPVWLAAVRKSDPDFPRYNRFRLLATGEIRDDRLVPVDTKAKYEAAKNNFADAVLLYPENSDFEGDRRFAQNLSCSKPLSRIREDICRIIEAGALVIPDYSYAMHRLDSLEKEVRHDNCSKWEFMLDRLNNITGAILPSRNPERHLLGLMLKSAVYCHMGDTISALAWNRKAKDFAASGGMKKQLLRLEIEELIDFQDLEDFGTIARLKDQLADNIEQFGDDDLRMRYYGTMGQVNAYAFLAGIDGFSRELSLQCFRNAVQCAFRLDSDVEAAQDLNYVHLWHAVFEPGSPAEDQAWKEAGEHICRQLRNHPESAAKDRYYLSRQRAFAGYRKFLLTGSFPDPVQFRSQLRLPRGKADDWLFAVTLKYIAAVETAAGMNEQAKADFDEALDVLKKTGHPILALIRMTILAEAWRSLRIGEYKEQALAALDALQKLYPHQSAKWRDFLLGERNFPGLEYWY